MVRSRREVEGSLEAVEMMVEVMVMATMVARMAGVEAGRMEAKSEVDVAMVAGLMVEECCS